MKRPVIGLTVSLLLGALVLTALGWLPAGGATDGLAQPARGAILTLAVPDMTCGSCESRIRSALLDGPGVREVRVDLRSLTVQVRYDPAAADPKTLADRVTGAGYPARYLPPGAQVPSPRSAGGGCGGGCCDNRG